MSRVSRGEQEEQFYRDLGQRVLHARRKAGLTQQELSNALGMTRTSVVNIEKGRHKVLSFTLAALSQILKVEVSNLLPKAHEEHAIDQLLRDRSRQTQDFVRSVLASSAKK